MTAAKKERLLTAYFYGGPYDGEISDMTIGGKVPLEIERCNPQTGRVAGYILAKHGHGMAIYIYEPEKT